jgi:ATP-dependent DNA helicase RecG
MRRPADLGRKSVRRNSLIANLLHRISFIEKAGTGIKRMREAAREQGCPEPAFTENGFFTVVFFPNPEVRAQIAAPGEEVTPEVTPEVTGEAPRKSPRKFSDYSQPWKGR